jgi:cytochrome P450/spermidine synthase
MAPSNLDVLAYEESPLGAICLRRRELLSDPGTIVTEITLDHELLMSSHHTASEVALSRCALEQHAGDGLRVLIGGLGLGYTAHEVLRSDRVTRVEVVELLPQVITWLREGLVPLSDALNGDARLAVTEADIYARLAANPDTRFDLILIDVDHSPDERLGPGNAGFYTEVGLRRARQHLAPGGVLGVWSYAESSPFVSALRAVFEHVDIEPVTFDNDFTNESETNWLFFARDARGRGILPGETETKESEMAASYDVLAPVHESAARDQALAELRRNAPIQWDDENAWWLVTRHADVREVSSHPEIFSSEPKGPWHVFEHRFSMQAMDGKPHLRHRNIVSRAFTPRMASLLSQRAARYADEAIDELEGRNHADFVTALAVPVPMRIIADMLGVADGDLGRFREWSDAMITLGGGHGDAELKRRSAGLIAELNQYIGEKVEQRRDHPEDDILSRIIEAADEGLLEDAPGDIDPAWRLHPDEIKDMALFLLIAGNETTRNGISQGMLALFQHPEERARLARDPALWETAADEILRWTSPVRAMRRVALRDTKLAGQPIREGDSVVMVYASANRDENVFDDPHTFRVDRTPNDHLALGFGPHYCLGANLAKMEIRVTLRKILERLPELRLADGTEPVFTPSALIDGVEAMPVEW